MHAHDKQKLIEDLQWSARELSAAELFQLSAISFNAGCVRQGELSNKLIAVKNHLHIINTLLFSIEGIQDVQLYLRTCIELTNEALMLDGQQPKS